jgi:hypothetical protein
LAILQLYCPSNGFRAAAAGHACNKQGVHFISLRWIDSCSRLPLV